MTKRMILLLAVVLLASLIMGCDKIEWITGDQGAIEGHQKQTGDIDDTAVPGYTPERTEQ